MSSEPEAPFFDREAINRAAGAVPASIGPIGTAPGAAASFSDYLQPLAPGHLPQRSRRLKSSLSIVCSRCELINHVAADLLDRSSTCEHCGQALFQGRVLDLHGANFDLHVQANRIPTAVVFWAPWCKPCHRVLALAERAARELEPRIRFARVTTDEERELVARCNVRGIPTLLLYKAGKEAARRIGRVDMESIVAWAGA